MAAALWLVRAPPGSTALALALMSLLYPQQFPDDLREVTKDFYKRFYKVDLTQQQVDGLLASATASKK